MHKHPQQINIKIVTDSSMNKQYMKGVQKIQKS